MATGPEILQAVYDISRPFSVGSEVTLSNEDALDLCKLAKQDLLAFGFGEQEADQTVEALANQNLSVLGDGLGLRLTKSVADVPNLAESSSAFRAACFCFERTMRLCRYVLHVARSDGANHHALNTARNYHLQLQTALRHAQQSLNARVRDRLHAVCIPARLDGQDMMRHEIVLNLAGRLVQAVRDAGQALVGLAATEQALAQAIFDRWAEINPSICDTCFQLQSFNQGRFIQRLEAEYRAIHVQDALP